jgi:DNA-directed RNA polymerase alpha subunit
MTQKNIDTMSTIVDYLAEGKKISHALNYVYTKRNVLVPFNEDDMDAPLQALSLTKRTQNALMRAGARTISDTIRLSTSTDFVRIRNFGRVCGIELFESLLDYCWDHMSDENRTLFLIDAVNRNVDNLREA